MRINSFRLNEKYVMRSIVKMSKAVFLFLFMSVCQMSRGQDIPAAFHVPDDSTETGSFDLLIYGRGLHEDALKVSMKTNPAYGGKWQEPGEAAGEESHDGRFLLLGALDKELYMGQDIRENYLAIRLESTTTDRILISAVYVLPPDTCADHEAFKTLAGIIEERPHELKEISLALHVRPKAYVLEPGAMWTGHIEAIVRQYKPGVREVKWLDIIF